MAMSPSGVAAAAPGIRAIAYSSVSVRSCSGFSLDGLALGGMTDLKMKTAGP